MRELANNIKSQPSSRPDITQSDPEYNAYLVMFLSND